MTVDQLIASLIKSKNRGVITGKETVYFVSDHNQTAYLEPLARYEPVMVADVERSTQNGPVTRTLPVLACPIDGSPTRPAVVFGA